MAGSPDPRFVLSDIASGVECVPLLVREESLIGRAFERLRLARP
jgi:hypothetical protein